jgi:phosphoglycolate phosphatase
LTVSIAARLAEFQPALVVFDKDGTLIDFHSMWGGWMHDLADRLEAASGVRVTEALFRAFGYDGAGSRTRGDAMLAITPMAILRQMAGGALRQSGCAEEQIEPALAAAWHVPDPVALARPLADLRRLFENLRAMGAFVTIATGDDRAPTLATLKAFGVDDLVDGCACGDDGLPTKPAPDAVQALCRSLGVQPGRAVVVGDTVADLQMGRSAGAGLVLGVLSGVSSGEDLARYADYVIPSVADLLA